MTATQQAVARFSALGEHGLVWLAIAAAGWLLDSGRRAQYARAARTVLVTYGANQLMKVVVRRRRPADGLAGTMSNLSYPSAHAATSVAGARALSPLLPPAPLWALAAGLAASRPYLGVHYPSDSLAGAALGAAVAELHRGERPKLHTGLANFGRSA